MGPRRYAARCWSLSYFRARDAGAGGILAHASQYFRLPDLSHPQLGPVDIGGWHGKLYQQNAPLQYLPELCEQHSRFTLAHAALCPYLNLRTVQVEPRGAELWHLVVVVQNNGFLPTYTSKKALERKCVRPIEVELTLPEGISLVSGQLRQDVSHLEGRSNKIWGRGAGSSPTD